MMIHLIRHGQSTGDIEDRYGGDYDDHLTEAGRKQAVSMADELIDVCIERLYASPKIRAQETAHILSDRLRIPFETLGDFRERNGYGVMTGMVKTEAARKYPDYVRGISSDVHFTVEGGEMYGHFHNRIVSALAQLARVPAETVAVITHGGPVRLIFRDILKLGEIDIGDCAVAVIEASENGYRLIKSERLKVRDEGVLA